MKDKLKSLWINLKTSRVAQAGVVLLLCSIIQRYPWLITWMGDDVAMQVQTWIANIKIFALGVIAIFIKQFNFTGGTQQILPPPPTDPNK